MGSDAGWTDAQLDAVAETELDRSMFDTRTLLALDLADAMTVGDVDDRLFGALVNEFGEDAVVELVAVIAWENASARFNRAIRVPSQKLWDRP